MLRQARHTRSNENTQSDGVVARYMCKRGPNPSTFPRNFRPLSNAKSKNRLGICRLDNVGANTA